MSNAVQCPVQTSARDRFGTLLSGAFGVCPNPFRGWTPQLEGSQVPRDKLSNLDNNTETIEEKHPENLPRVQTDR